MDIHPCYSLRKFEMIEFLQSEPSGKPHIQFTHLLNSNKAEFTVQLKKIQLGFDCIYDLS